MNPEELSNLHIVSLSAQNVMRIKAVKITPNGSTVVIGGDNGEGKTSILNSIAWVLGGGKELPEEPVRRGEQASLIIADLGDIIVERHTKADGKTELAVKNKDGLPFRSPQKILEALVGKICFDPVSFLHLDPDKQLATLKNVVGLDFSEMDAEYDRIYQTRTVVGRNLKSLEAMVATPPFVDRELPAEPLDPVEIAKKVAELDGGEARLDELEAMGREANEDMGEAAALVTRLEKELTEAKDDLVKAQAKLEQMRAAYKAKKEELAKTDGPALRKQLEEINKTNELVRQKQRYDVDMQNVEKHKLEVQQLTDALSDIEAKKEQALSAAKFPVPGLTFNDKGIMFNAIPFEQASAAQRLRSSIAIGIALNPKIRVMIIRDGSLLDERNMELIAEMAEEHKMQIWIERVGDGEECSVIIEDGAVAEDRTQKPKPKPKSKGPTAKK